MIVLGMTGTSLVYGDEILSYIKNTDFFKANGDVAWSIDIDTEIGSGTYKDVAFEAFDQLHLAPGKAVAIYVAKNNPQKGLICEQVPLTFRDIDELNAHHITANNYDFKPEILEKYEFGEGSVTNNMLLPDDYQRQMIYEATITGKNVIVKDIEPSDEVVQIKADYYKKEQSEDTPEFTVNLIEWPGDKVFQTDEEDMVNNYEKIMLGDSEILYAVSSGQKRLSWVLNGCYYIISSNQDAMTKEKLLEIIKALELK